MTGFELLISGVRSDRSTNSATTVPNIVLIEALLHFRILMEGSPHSNGYDEISRDLSQIGNVVHVHDLHLWSVYNKRLIVQLKSSF